MEFLRQRIIDLRKSLNLKQTQFAERIGVTSQLISTIEAGKAKVTEANIRLICLTFGVREEWLRDGAGEMMDKEILISEQKKKLLNIFDQLTFTAQILLTEYAEKLVADEKALKAEAAARAAGEMASEK